MDPGRIVLDAGREEGMALGLRLHGTEPFLFCELEVVEVGEEESWAAVIDPGASDFVIRCGEWLSTEMGDPELVGR